MTFPPQVKIVEVGPRDGLQNEKALVPLHVKVSLIEGLTEAGLRTIESGSFVSPKWVPQMADTAAVLSGVRRVTGVEYPVLVPNLKGLEAALAAGAKEIAVFTSASESFSQSNTNCTIDESLRRCREVVKAASVSGLPARGYVSCALVCPYEGEITPEAVARVASELAQMGCYEISLGDTIGAGTPVKVQAMLRAVTKHLLPEQTAVHFHDTWGQALANILASLDYGIATVDSSVAGLGGCPYAPGATGNVATEDVVYMLSGMGIETGVDLPKLAAVGREINKQLGRPLTSKVAVAMQREPETK
ncbi:MAG: hydroxymethylglutaryl-CoA lyase [Acidobacteriaceae bacterium]|nr:hydroxymethylglutaryl-CoA lyase [Acidobacteriaceae bacterium]MBV9939198.1 hydroxymethylglutaryl-CoA lyase [Acidobacteriaceae bacterium]